GCVGTRGHVDRVPGVGGSYADANAGPPAPYIVHCPDVLDIAVQPGTSFSGPRRVGADGRIDLGDAGQPRVDGLALPAVTRVIAEAVNVAPGQVRVNVAEFNSQQIYVNGEVHSQERAVPYRGPETVVDLLHRIGGLSFDAAPSDIQVIRSHVADGGSP